MSGHHDLASEAEAFDERILERTSAGFIPDLRRCSRVEYFYKSFWRDPVFTDLYVGEMFRNYLRMIRQNVVKNARILDVGCGAGYFALELAREGYSVVGIDISEENIRLAKQMLLENTFKDNFGSLEYYNLSIEQLLNVHKLTDKFDVVLFSGVLHHLENIEEVLGISCSVLKDDGIIISHEPCHESWSKNDAGVVALIRMLLSLCGKWHETADNLMPTLTMLNFDKLANEILLEYQEERDKHESGQSPHDNTFNGVQIYEVLKRHTQELEYKPSSSFIYRVLGGIRSELKNEHDIAKLLAIFDRFAVDAGLINPNYFYFCGRK